MDKNIIIEQMVLLIPLMVAGGGIDQAKDTIRSMLRHSIELDRSAVVRYKNYIDTLLDLREEAAIESNDADIIQRIDNDITEFSRLKEKRLSLLKQERADMTVLASANSANELIEILRHLA